MQVQLLAVLLALTLLSPAVGVWSCLCHRASQHRCDTERVEERRERREERGCE
jgi:hypothetical protein